LRDTKTPFFSLLEGGYSRDLPELILAYLQGVEGQECPRQTEAKN
jgi:acetoin utilization deacetylase AcuC-like enzyme